MRRWNTDPKPVTWESPYAANRNNPIVYADPNGDIPAGKILGKIGKAIGQIGKNIGSLFTNKPWGSKGTALAGKPKSIPKIEAKPSDWVKGNNSGWLAAGGRFVTEQYLKNLKDNDADWAARLYEKVEERTHIEYKPDYDAVHKIPDYGKVESASFEDETGTNENTSLAVWFKGKAIVGGEGLLPVKRSLNNPKSGNLLRVVSSSTLDKSLNDQKREIMGDAAKSFYEASEAATKAMEQFNFGVSTSSGFSVIEEGPSFKYRIKVNYK
jgi:hypothetical protein